MLTNQQRNVCVNLSPTMLDSFNFFKNAPKSWKSKAKEELLLKINKIPFKPSPEIQFGLDFEVALQEYSEENAPKEAFRALLESSFVGDHLALYKSAIWQKWTSRTLLLDKIEINLIGRIDCFLPYRVIDIKTTRNFRGEAKYLSGMQHVIYCLTESVLNFEYHVYEFSGERIIDKHVIDYVAPDENTLINIVKSSANEFFEFLDHEGYLDVYKDKFATNKRKRP